MLLTCAVLCVCCLATLSAADVSGADENFDFMISLGTASRYHMHAHVTPQATLLSNATCRLAAAGLDEKVVAEIGLIGCT
jgi:hypothetical protein